MHPHFFADNQYCIKCGKYEGDPVADDCPATLEQYDEWVKETEGKVQFPWTYYGAQK